eukprot:403364663
MKNIKQTTFLSTLALSIFSLQICFSKISNDVYDSNLSKIRNPGSNLSQQMVEKYESEIEQLQRKIQFLQETGLKGYEVQLSNHSDKKILLMGSFISSHAKTILNVCEYLKQHPSFKHSDITIVLPVNSAYRQKYEQLGVKIIVNYGIDQAYFDEIQEKISRYTTSALIMFEYNKKEIQCYNDNATLVNEIKAQKFDMLIDDMTLVDGGHVPSLLDIPLRIKFLGTIPDSNFVEVFGFGPQHSSVTNFFRTTIFGKANTQSYYDLQGTFTHRLQNLIASFMWRGVIANAMKVYFALNIQNSPLKLFENKRGANLTIFTAIEGLYQPISLPSNVKVIWPLHDLKTKGKVASEIAFDQEIQSFLDNHSKVALVAFGSSQNPTNQSMTEIINFMIQRQDYAFIMATKNERSFNKSLFDEARKHSHILIAKWIPQAQLLKHHNVKIFLSHGGANSFSEAIQANVPLIINPLVAPDQEYFCEYAQIQKVGICPAQTTVSELNKAIDALEQNNFFTAQLQYFKGLVEKKKQDPHDLGYWLDYTLTIGTRHLQNEQIHNFNYFQLHDIDVYLVLGAGLFATMFIGLQFARIILWVCCCRCLGRKNEVKHKNITPNQKFKQQ